MSFCEEAAKQRSALEKEAQKAVELAVKGGAQQCEVTIQGYQGLEVSTRGAEVENIEFNKASGMEVVVYKDQRRGTASTTDFTADALNKTVEAALSIAGFTDQDPYAGLCDKELLCTQEQDLDLVHDIISDPDECLQRSIALEKLVLDNKPQFIKDSDGTGYESILNLRVIANSHGFCKSSAATYHYNAMTVIAEKNGRMQRGSGYTISRTKEDLWSIEKVAQEALDRALAKLDASKIPTGRCNVIFTRGAALSLWGHLLSAISGGAVYRKTSFLAESLKQKILPEFITLHENPFIKRGLSSFNFDAEGLQVRENDLIKDGVLEMFLLSTYTGRKLGMPSNAHCGGTANLFVSADDAHTKSFEDLLKEAGEGLVITDLMGQGIDLVSGNYSRGASGYYFKNGEKVHAVEEVTVAGNLKEMFSNIALVGTDRDPRSKIQSGSLLIPGMTVSGD